MVCNIDVPENSSLPHAVQIAMKPVLEVFVSQIKLLLGITTQVKLYPISPVNSYPGKL